MSAAVRLSPVPPALSEIRNTGTLPSWNFLTSAGPVAGPAGQLEEIDPGRLEILFDEGEHGGELGKEEDAAAFLDELGEKVVTEKAELAAGLQFFGGLGFHQRRVAADLP